MIAFWGRRVGVALSCFISYFRVNGRVEMIDMFFFTFLRAL